MSSDFKNIFIGAQMIKSFDRIPFFKRCVLKTNFRSILETIRSF